MVAPGNGNRLVRGGAVLGLSLACGVGAAAAGEALTNDAKQHVLVDARTCLDYVNNNPSTAADLVPGSSISRPILDACGFKRYSSTEPIPVDAQNGVSTDGVLLIKDFSVRLPTPEKLEKKQKNVEREAFMAKVAVGSVGIILGLALGRELVGSYSRRKRSGN